MTSLLRFCGLIMVGPLLSMQVQKANFIKNVLICVPKIIKGLACFEAHESK